jgi:hypothetical protein
MMSQLGELFPQALVTRMRRRMRHILSCVTLCMSEILKVEVDWDILAPDIILRASILHAIVIGQTMHPRCQKCHHHRTPGSRRAILASSPTPPNIK